MAYFLLDQCVCHLNIMLFACHVEPACPIYLCIGIVPSDDYPVTFRIRQFACWDIRIRLVRKVECSQKVGKRLIACAMMMIIN